MTPDTQAAWDRWANGIAAKVAGRFTLEAVDKILAASKTALAARDTRIAQLEQRIAGLEQRLSAEVIEWPVKSRSAA